MAADWDDPLQTWPDEPEWIEGPGPSEEQLYRRDLDYGRLLPGWGRRIPRRGWVSERTDEKD